MGDEQLALRTERLGPLPVVNHFLERLGLEGLLERAGPAPHPRRRLPFAKALGVLLRSVLVEREPIYRQHETVATFHCAAFGLDEELVRHVSDDTIGRALDHLFDADRSALLTEVVVAAAKEFNFSFDELHNDSTSIRFAGQYAAARGRQLRGKRAPFITYGYSKDHRFDLKQLLFILTTTADGMPVQFRCEAGNTSDARTHEETWDTLVRASGRTDFLYVADSKLCSADPMEHIDSRGGRFVVVMPRSRREDKDFRGWIQTNEPSWELVRNRPNPRRRGGPRDRWWTFRDPLPSREAWPVIWVYSSLLRRHQQHSRRERIGLATNGLKTFNAKLTGPRPRRRGRRKVEERVNRILRRRKVSQYIKVKIIQDERAHFKQAGPGRPGANTRYVRKTRKFWRLEWSLDEDKIAYDHKSDGMYPLLTNDRKLTDRQVLEAHKRQPVIEKRFEQVKTVFEIAPVLLKNEGRIEALFFVYFLALLIQALIERELRATMKREGIEQLPLYPEERANRRPTAEQILRLFSLAQRNILLRESKTVQVFKPELTELQLDVLRLLGVPKAAYDGSQNSGETASRQCGM